MQTPDGGPAPRTRGERTGLSASPPPTHALPRALRLAGLTLLIACSGLSQQAARVSEQVVGLRSSTLETCLGEAPYFEIGEDGSELWAYTDRTPESEQSIEVSRATGQGTRFQRPRVEAGILDDPDAGSSGSIAVDLEETAPGQCVYIFSIDAGLVRSVEVRGRARSGLNADALCATLLDRCIPERPGDT